VNYPISCINKSLKHKNNIVLVGAHHDNEKPRDFNVFSDIFNRELLYDADTNRLMFLWGYVDRCSSLCMTSMIYLF